jgi:hypothetical protein
MGQTTVFSNPSYFAGMAVMIALAALMIRLPLPVQEIRTNRRHQWR